MIYITGDVHLTNIQGWEQKKIGSEVIISQKYLGILKKYKLSSTLFINGACLEKEGNSVRKLLNYDVELGGHTYDNFGHPNIIKNFIYRKIWKCVYGPKNYQKKDIGKTKKAFEKFGLKMTSWRTHCYASNNETFKLLPKFGVKFVSDLFNGKGPFKKNGLIHLPINIPVDQNTIIYGPFSPENREPFVSCAKSRIMPEEWLEIVKRRIIANEKKGKPSILLVHPATMACLDNFKIFEELAKFLSKYQSQKISEFSLIS